jgi:prolyl-tRNA synthetase
MLQSKLFTKTRKEAPSDEVSKNAQLLIRAGFIHKEMAGVYSYLPLGLRVLNNICNIIREEMNAIGGQEMTLTVLQDKKLWEKTNRWSDEQVDVWFKTKLKNDTELGLGFTQEEELTNLMRDHIQSFRDLPAYPYQIQLKFRNEIRSKSGIMRGREFLMKDLYSFSKDVDTHSHFYEEAKKAYTNVFNRMGIGEQTHITMASGGSFSKYSHEFQTETEAGEDIIHVCTKCNVAINKEIFSEYKECPDCHNAEFREVKAVEVGNIFTLGTRFSEALDLKYKDEEGEEQFVFMGSYGIGPSRVMGTIVEILSDEKGIIWPESVAPFKIHLIPVGQDEATFAEAKNIYDDLQKNGVQVLYDDRADKTAGGKFADADLIGIPYRVVVSAKTLEKDSVELKERSKAEAELVNIKDLIKKFA